MTKKQQTPIQFKIAAGDTVLHALIERLSNEGDEQKGYVAEQLRLRLRCFEEISRVLGLQHDPLAVVSTVSGLTSDVIREDQTKSQPQKQPDHIPEVQNKSDIKNALQSMFTTMES